MARYLLPVLLLACDPSTAKVTGDTGAVIDENTDADADSDADSDTDADSDADTDADPEPVPNFDVWEGERTFYVDYYDDRYDCTGDTIGEAGDRMSSGSDYNALQDACPSCTYIYAVSPDAGNACGDWVQLSDPSYRGLIFDGDQVSYVFFQVDRGSVSATTLDDNAGWDGFTVTYTYEMDWYYGSVLTVDGSVTFPEMMP